MTILTLILGGLLLFLPFPVLAAANPQAACAMVPGGCPPANVFATSTVPAIAGFLIRAASGLSVIFVVFAGYQLLTAFGDESKISKGKWAVVWALTGLVLAISSQLLVSFVATEPRFATVASEIDIMASVLEILVLLFNSLFLIMVVIAGVQWVIARGAPEDIRKGKLMVSWAIGGAIVVNVAHALVRAVTSFYGI